MKRPTAVTVFGILNIVFAILGILSVLASMVLLLAVHDVSKNPVVQILQEHPGYALYLKVSAGIGALVCGALLAAGIGLLQLKPWARMLSIAYGIFGLVSVPINTVLSYLYVTKPLLQQAQHQNGPESAAAVGGAIGGMAGGCFGLIYPLLLLIFMLLPKVSAAFKPAPAIEVGSAE